MNNEQEHGGFTERLWGTSAKEKAHRLVPESGNKVVPLRPDRTYVAFEIRDHAQRLHIRCATQPSRFPAYSSLLDIIYDHDFEKSFTLVYSFMLVEITGNHLGAVVHAINFGNCERIHQFHKKLHDSPAADEPVIELITITSAIGK